MEQNEITKERYALKLLNAMEDADMTNSETAERFNFSVTYLSHIKRKENFHHVPPKAWARIRDYYYSGTPLKEYRWKESEVSAEAPDLEAAEINQQEADRERAETKLRSKLAVKGLLRAHGKEVAEAVAESVNTEEPTKREVATKMRKAYTRAQKPETTEEVTKVVTKGSKVDLSEINFRSGVKLVIEIYEDGFILKTKIPVKS
jgi:hypothetical protein